MCQAHRRCENGSWDLCKTRGCDPGADTCFWTFKWAVEGADCKLIGNSLKPVGGHYEIDFEDFEEKIKTYHPSLFLLVNPHNPTGRVFTKEELNRLVDICYENNVKIISDEVHCLVLYGENTHTPILPSVKKLKRSVYKL